MSDEICADCAGLDSQGMNFCKKHYLYFCQHLCNCPSCDQDKIPYAEWIDEWKDPKKAIK